MVTKQKKQKRIWVTDEITAKLRVEFKVTGVSILNALKFSSYSENARNIRVRAMELMTEVNKNNEDLFNDFH
jgi:hypothetical protein